MKSLIFYLVILILSSSCVKKSTTTTATADTVGINAASVAKDSRSKENTKTPTLNFTYTVANSIGGSIAVANSGAGATNTAIPSTTSTNSVSLAVGSSAAVTAVPATGYTFSGWTGGCVNTSTSCSISLTANTQPVVATFAPIVVVAPNVSTFAGTLGVRGGANGIGTSASFYFLSTAAIATDRSGNVYVADEYNNCIRKITPLGVVSTLAGTPTLVSRSIDGTGPAAGFGVPSGIAVDYVGNVFVTDRITATIRKITPEGVVTTIAGKANMNGSADGIGSAARFYFPAGIVVDSVGNLLVADQQNNTIRKITPAGVVTTVAGVHGISGSADGVGANARFYHPTGLALDSADNLYISDYVNNTIRKMTPDGVVTTIAGDPLATSGHVDGIGSAARFLLPNGLAVDSSGNIFVADSWNATIRKISPSGNVTTVAGVQGSTGNNNGAPLAARFYYPCGIALDSSGNLYVGDSLNEIIRKIKL
jgi:uncharacterized repeat protein (TIGR02543 family)